MNRIQRRQDEQDGQSNFDYRKFWGCHEPQRRDERRAAKPQPKGLNKLKELNELKEEKGGWNFVAGCEQVGLLQRREDKEAERWQGFGVLMRSPEIQSLSPRDSFHFLIRATRLHDDLHRYFKLR